MKKNITFLIATVIFLSLCVSTAAEGKPSLCVINGKPLSENINVIKRYDKPMYPLRPIFEGLGTDLTWHKDSQTIRFATENGSYVIKIGSKIMCLNYVVFQTDIAPIIVDGNTMVTADFIEKTTGASVSYIESIDKVNIVSKK